LASITGIIAKGLEEGSFSFAQFYAGRVKRSYVHVFDVGEGGLFRISLTYDEPTGIGETTAHTDTYHGHFVKLVPNEQVVEVMEFETADAAMRGEMMVTFTLTDAGGGTDVLAVHDNVPPGVSPADNETGWQMSLDKLATFVEHPA
jgi:uncharacterized protein YndB with AHSA1/START domain